MSKENYYIKDGDGADAGRGFVKIQPAGISWCDGCNLFRKWSENWFKRKGAVGMDLFCERHRKQKLEAQANLPLDHVETAA
jgi:hypothetical protein